MAKKYISYASEEGDFYPEEGFDLEEAEYEEMYGHLGYFISQFSVVELSITAILAFAADVKDLETFHILTKGMDAKQKCSRLWDICAPKKWMKSDSRLSRRLDYFVDIECDLRNRLAHSALVKAKNERSLALSNIARLPFKALKLPKKQSYNPDEIAFDMLLAHANWLSDFSDDLVPLFPKAQQHSVLEIENPGSMEPKEFRQYLAGIERRANLRRQRQKPLPK